MELLNVSPLTTSKRDKKIEQGIYILDNQGVRSLICAIDPKESDNIVIHEKTSIDKLKGMIRFVKSSKALMPISMFTEEKVDLEVGELVYKSYNERTKLYKVKNHEKIVKQFRELSKIYVLDGHHRLETMKELNLGKIYINLYNFDDISIFPYHRVVKGKVTKELFETMNQVYDVKEGFNNKAISLNVDKKWYHINNQTRYSDYEFLEYFLVRNLEIKNPRDTKLIDYVPGVIKKDDFVKDLKKNQMGFFMTPIEKQVYLSYIKRGKTFPVKSTWVMPRFPKHRIKILKEV